MRINAATMLLESQTVTAGGHTAAEHVRALTRRPKLATPTPTC
jgi:hypothetical protein